MKVTSDTQILPSQELQALQDKLQAIRAFLVPHWIEWGKIRDREVTAAGEGMCRFTSAFLVKALGPGWKFDGGYPERFNFETMQWHGIEAGFRDRKGAWQAHHWVRKGSVIVDITASQFGEDEIIITDTKDPRFVSSMTPLAVQEALRDVKARAKDWHAAWQASNAQPAQVDLPILYHGTTRRKWNSKGNGTTSLYLTSNRAEAENYADESASNEACDHRKVEAVIVAFAPQDLQKLILSGQVALEPDWGWVDGMPKDAMVPSWEESLATCGSLCLSGFKDEFKKLASVAPLIEPGAKPRLAP